MNIYKCLQKSFNFWILKIKMPISLTLNATYQTNEKYKRIVVVQNSFILRINDSYTTAKNTTILSCKKTINCALQSLNLLYSLKKAHFLLHDESFKAVLQMRETSKNFS